MTTETRTISNTDDVIDSRDVIERIDELTAERDKLIGAREAVTVDDVDAYNTVVHYLKQWHEDYGTELDDLVALAIEASDYAADWEYGETLIRDTYFQDYAEQLAEDIGAIPSEQQAWPLYCIDWERAARDLQMDYTSVEFDGVTYWIR